MFYAAALDLQFRLLFEWCRRVGVGNLLGTQTLRGGGSRCRTREIQVRQAVEIRQFVQTGIRDRRIT